MSVRVIFNLKYRRAIELVETESQAIPGQGQSVCNLNNPIESVDEVPKVNIRHIMSASSSLNDSQSLVRLRALHTNQKIILVSMIILKDRLGEQQKLEPVFLFLLLTFSYSKVTPKFVNRME